MITMITLTQKCLYAVPVSRRVTASHLHGRLDGRTVSPQRKRFGIMKMFEFGENSSFIIFVQVETFSLHVRQNQLDITACGWFTIDRTMTYAVRILFGEYRNNQTLISLTANCIIKSQMISSAISHLVLIIQTSITDPNYTSYH